MTLTEWFWLAKAKLDEVEAEVEAMKRAADPHYMSEAEWDELRAEHRRKMEALKDG